jgi:hypothetical protein
MLDSYEVLIRERLAFDKLFAECGIEANDLLAGIKKHSLYDDPEVMTTV